MTDLDITLYRPGDPTGEYADDVWAILVAVDREFFPALSSRDSTTSTAMAVATNTTAPQAYFDEVLTNEVVFVARSEGRAVGLLTFVPHYDDDLLVPYSPSSYVSTIAVLPAFRRRGIATALSRAFDDRPSDLDDEWVTQRTWSTNDCNLELMNVRGFREILRLKDHRAAGVDTVYFARPSALTELRPQYRERIAE